MVALAWQLLVDVILVGQWWFGKSNCLWIWFGWGDGSSGVVGCVLVG